MDTKVCGKCREVKLFSEFNKKKASKDGYQTKCKVCVKEYRAANSEKIKEYDAEYRAAHLEKRKERNAKYYAANSEEEKDRVAEYQKANPEKCRAKSAEYRAANIEKKKDYDAKYCASNLEKFRANTSKRRAIKLKAIPKWLTKADYQVMDAIHKEAKRLEAKTGIKHHVDHIHPLQGKLICGLHCPSNLQILTAAQNCSKGNKFTPYVESES